MGPMTGMALAGLGMSAYSAFGGGGSKKPWYDESWFNQRESQINTFESNLNSARTNYLTSLNNMYNQAYSRFSGNAEAGFANRGMSVSGGAFASALAKKTAEFQAQGDVTAAQMAREDLGTVEGFRSALFGMKTSVKSGAANMEYATSQANQRAFGNFAGNVMMAGIQGGMGGGKPSPADMARNEASGITGAYSYDNTVSYPMTHDKLGLFDSSAPNPRAPKTYFMGGR